MQGTPSAIAKNAAPKPRFVSPKADENVRPTVAIQATNTLTHKSPKTTIPLTKNTSSSWWKWVIYYILTGLGIYFCWMKWIRFWFFKKASRKHLVAQDKPHNPPLKE